MSAIFGIMHFDGAAASARDMEDMSKALAHRGPDARKFIAQGAVGLGHCLLQVNREDLFEAQPLHDRDLDLTLVADLRLDNRETLAADFGIGAATLRDLPDSALVLEAYKKWGENCAERLLGDFAFALWDGRAKKLLLGRDHMGQRHIHYYKGKDFFAFATEIKALWALPGVPRALEEAQLGRYVLFDSRTQSGLTLFKDVFGVPGGSILTLGVDGRLVSRRYWQPQGDPAHAGRDETYYIEAYRRILAEAVECRVRRLIAPPALCFSGGYDSAAIAGLCSPILTAQGRKLIAIASVMPDDYTGPLSSARRWVDLCRRDMTHLDVHYFVRRDENLFTDAENAFAIADGIPSSSHYVSGAMFRQAASAGVRLIMDGLVGDGTLNPRGGGVLEHFLRTGQIRRFIAEFRAHRRLSGRTLLQVLRYDLLWPMTPYPLRRAWQMARRGFAPAWANRAVAPKFARALIRSGAIRPSALIGETQPHLGLRARMQRTLNNWAVAARRHDDPQAAALGLDLTRPMADKRVVELGLAIPEELYVKDGRNRYLACRALADIYPVEFQTRARGQDPRAPDVADMLRAARPLLQSEIERLSSSAVLRNYFDFAALKKYHAAQSGGQSFNADAQRALGSLWAAKYMAWFNRGNV